MKKFILLFIMVIILNLAFSAHASIVDVSVDANYNSVFVSPCDPGNPPPYTPTLADTGLDLNIGDSITITTEGLWRISGSDPWVNANGQVGRDSGGFYISSLLGQISSIGPQMYRHGQPIPPLFYIGTNYSSVVTQQGRLYLGFNDTDYGNNEGSVIAHITHTSLPTPVPEPSAMFLFPLGLAGLRFFRRTRV